MNDINPHVAKALARAGGVLRLARDLGICRTTVHAWLSGKHKPSIAMEARLEGYVLGAVYVPPQEKKVVVEGAQPHGS